MKKKCLFTLFLSFFLLSQIALGDNCSIETPNFTKTATEYQQVFEDLNRQIRYAKRNALLDSINDLGLDPKMIEFMSPFSIQVLSSKIDLSANEITQVANAGGYKPARRIGNLEIDQIVKRNLDNKDKTPVGVTTFETEVSGVKIAVDYRDYSQGRFRSHPSIDMDGFPQKSKLGKMPSDQMISEALVKYKQANPDGIPLSQGNEPVFYRIISKGELEELLSTGQSRSNGSITDWASDFVNPAEKKWMLDNNISESSVRDLIKFKNLKPDQIQKINSEFKAKFGRDLPKYFQTHDEIRISFVDNLLRGLSNDTNPRASHLKERLPVSTKKLIDRFTVNGQVDKAALGRYIEDNILSLPPGPRRNDAVLDLYGYDYSARLHADYVPGFDEFSPFKGTSIGMPISDFLRDDTYLVAIRDVHGRARKNLGNAGEREWFYKDGLAIDEVAGIWAERDLGNIRNGDIMTKAPEAVDDPNWGNHVSEKWREELVGEPSPILR